jgi:hypothetical protein
VDNSTGRRRKILTSSGDGTLVLAGATAAPPEADWSIEYCESHATPIRHERVWLDRDQTLFAVVSGSVFIMSPLTYVTSPTDPAYGTTKFKVSGGALAPGQDLAGLFLVDRMTSVAYYIEYGLDTAGYIGILYDRRARLQGADGFKVVAGHIESAAALAAKLMRITISGGDAAPDLSVADQLEVSVSGGEPLTITNPIGISRPTSGRRFTLTLVNNTSGALGNVTWGSAYRLSPWASPAPGHSRSIEFRHNGSSWIEIARTPADVPN